jgi:hypothetical protein
MDGIQLVSDKSTLRVPANDETALETVVATIGPVTTLFQASPDFVSYISGIYTSSKC